MPLYEYRCGKCGLFEKLQKISEPALTHCPTCDGAVERIVSREIGIAFKGTGFYSTDHNALKQRAREINKERQIDNKALLDGDVKSYVKQSEATTKKLQEG